LGGVWNLSINGKFLDGFSVASNGASAEDSEGCSEEAKDEFCFEESFRSFEGAFSP
jgi:hypothetical protein